MRSQTNANSIRNAKKFPCIFLDFADKVYKTPPANIEESMRQRSDIMSLIALLLALVAVAAAILFFLDSREEIATLRQSQLEIERHPQFTTSPTSQTPEQAALLRELEEQLTAVRRDLMTLAKKSADERTTQEHLETQTAAHAAALKRMGATLETEESAASTTIDIRALRDTLREHAVLIAALRADLGILTKRTGKPTPHTTPAAPDETTPGFSPALRQLDPLQQESDALQQRIQALQAMLQEKEADADDLSLVNVMKRLDVLEHLLVDSTRPETEPESAVALAELENTVGEILSVLADQKDTLRTLTDTASGSEAARASLQANLKTLEASIRKDIKRKDQTQETFNESTTRQTLALHDQIERVSRDLTALQDRGGLSTKLETQITHAADSLAGLQDQLREVQARIAPPPLYYFSVADGTYIVNPHKNFDALLLHKSFDPGKTAPVYTFLRIPFAPQGKRISTDALAADDSIGGIRALNTELVPLARAHSLPYSRRMPEIYYYTTPEGTYVLNPHAGTSAVLHTSGSTRFVVVPGSMRPQRVSGERLVADGVTASISCLNFRLVYFGHNRTFQFE